MRALADEMNPDKTLLGVDAVHDGALLGKDLNEKGTLELRKERRAHRYPRTARAPVRRLAASRAVQLVPNPVCSRQGLTLP